MPLTRWVANTKRVLAHDKLSNTDFEFQSKFPDGAPDGTPFSAAEMNKIIDAVNATEPQISTLTPLNGFSLTTFNSPAVAMKVGRMVYIQIGVEQPSATNRIFTQLPQGMFDGKRHLVTGTGGNNGDVYPIVIDIYGRMSFNGEAGRDVYINAGFICDE